MAGRISTTFVVFPKKAKIILLKSYFGNADVAVFQTCEVQAVTHYNVRQHSVIGTNDLLYTSTNCKKLHVTRQKSGLQ